MNIRGSGRNVHGHEYISITRDRITINCGFDRMGEGSSKTKLARFLLQYRNAPQGTTGQSHAELLMGRRLRSHPDLVHPNLSQRVAYSEGNVVKQNNTINMHANALLKSVIE